MNYFYGSAFFNVSEKTDPEDHMNRAGDTHLKITHTYIVFRIGNINDTYLYQIVGNQPRDADLKIPLSTKFIPKINPLVILITHTRILV